MKVAHVATVAALIILCSQVDSKSCLTGAPDNPFQKFKLRLAANGWATHQLTTNVAAILLREKLGFDVELVLPESDETTSDIFQKIDLGGVHVDVELWPQGNEHLFDLYEGVVALPYNSLVQRYGIYLTAGDSKFTLGDLTAEQRERLSRAGTPPASANQVALCTALGFTTKLTPAFFSSTLRVLSYCSKT